MTRVTVFAGSSPGDRPAYLEAAAGLGTALAGAGIGLVYGGASVGLMGAVAGAALAAGGEVIGVIPEILVRAEVAAQRLTRLEVVDSLHTRKARMAELCDAFVALPGGLGTLEELFEVLTWRQLGLHDKPVAVLDVAAYWEPLLAALDAQTVAGFIPPAGRALLERAVSPAEIVALATSAGRPPSAG